MLQILKENIGTYIILKTFRTLEHWIMCNTQKGFFLLFSDKILLYPCYLNFFEAGFTKQYIQDWERDCKSIYQTIN